MQGPAELFRDVKHGERQEQFGNSLFDSGITTATVTSPEGLEMALYQALVKPDRVGREEGGGGGRCLRCRRCGGTAIP
jgi:hypothetical protein